MPDKFRLLHSATGHVMLALLLGVGCGLTLPAVAAELDFVGKLLIQCVKAVATPLVFFAICDAILNHHINPKDFGRLLTVNLTNSTIAIGIGIVIANLATPGQYLQSLAGTVPSGKFDIAGKTDFKSLFLQQFPSSIVQPFYDNAIMPTVVLGVLLGFAVRKLMRESPGSTLSGFGLFAANGRNVCEIILSWIVRIIPFAVFGATAKVVAQHGLEAFKGLFAYAGWCLVAMILHVLLVYHAWIFWYARRSLLQFWRMALTPISYAFGVNSSLVSLPLTLKALDQMGVNRSASTLAACVGTNLNNDGIVLYEGFTLLVIAQAMGNQLSIDQQILAGIYCIFAAMGVAGIPEAGVVALTLVLTAFGIPTEMIALLLSVDWILARARSVVNVLSDMTGSIVIDRMQRPQENL